MNPTIQKLLKEFEENWEDKGDERYGLVKHNNTILQRQLDWLSTALETVARGAKGSDKLDAVIGGFQEGVKMGAADERARLKEVVEKLKRKHFTETTTYSEVQQENAWYNDAIRDVLSLLSQPEEK